MDRSPSSTASEPMSPEWMISSEPASAATASDLRRPCVSEITPSCLMIAPNFSCRDGLFNGFVHALVERATGHRLQRVAVLLGVRGSGVRVERLLVLPDLDDCEVIRAHRVLQDVEPQTPLFLAAGLRQSSE